MTAVRHEHGLAIVRDQRYSGIALERGADGFFRAKFFHEGMLTENWLAKYSISNDELWIPESDDLLGYDFDEFALVEGKLFYGVVFEENKGILRQICLFTKNAGWVDIENTDEGEVSSIDCFIPGKYTFKYSKYRNGGLAALIYGKHSIGEVRGSVMKITGSEDFSASISMNGSFDQEFTDELHEKLRFYSVDAPLPSGYRNVTFNECAVDDMSVKSIRNLLESFGFESASKITLFTEDVSSGALLEMINFKKANEIVFNYSSNQAPVPLELVEAVRSAYPDLQVEVKNPFQSQ